MFFFLLLLFIAAFAQIFGSIISWFFVKRFQHNLRTIIFSEILLMLIVSFLLIEEGLRITVFTVGSVTAGIISLSILNKLIPHRHETKTERICFLVFIAMCFHELPEGIAFGSSYLVDPYLSMITAFLIALHNLPEGSLISIPYFMKNKFISGLKAVSVTQLLYVTGGLIAYSLLINVSQQFQALAMTFAAGAMLYIIYEELLLMKK